MDHPLKSSPPLNSRWKKKAMRDMASREIAVFLNLLHISSNYKTEHLKRYNQSQGHQPFNYLDYLESQAIHINMHVL